MPIFILQNPLNSKAPKAGAQLTARTEFEFAARSIHPPDDIDWLTTTS